jgi:hypothetical protein
MAALLVLYASGTLLELLGILWEALRYSRCALGVLREHSENAPRTLRERSENAPRSSENTLGKPSILQEGIKGFITIHFAAKDSERKWMIFKRAEIPR